MHELERIVKEQKEGKRAGICSVCSSSPFVIDAAISEAKERNTHVLIEATANQVNQHGGYTGMEPADFRDMVLSRADHFGLERSRVILGGDHLGPVAWKDKNPKEAMNLAEELVTEFAKAGFEKIHIDTSMPLGDEKTLSTEEIADRAARLIDACEENFRGKHPYYVIGSEVPTPGGSGSEDALAVTEPDDLKFMLECFEERLSPDVWERVIAAVVQPGVEFGNTGTHEYVPEDARELVAAAKEIDGIVLEGHSTDYQKEESLASMVRDGVGILKVGPALTFAAREALYALSYIEDEMDIDDKSDFINVLDRCMLAHPESWRGHYTDKEPESTMLRKFSLSDRSRYYMSYPEVKAAIDKLFKNTGDMPDVLLSQFMPVQAGKGMEKEPENLVIDHIKEVLDIYWRACGQ